MSRREADWCHRETAAGLELQFAAGATAAALPECPSGVERPNIEWGCAR
jgi:hypothetical protein